MWKVWLFVDSDGPTEQGKRSPIELFWTAKNKLLSTKHNFWIKGSCRKRQKIFFVVKKSISLYCCCTRNRTFWSKVFGEESKKIFHRLLHVSRNFRFAHFAPGKPAVGHFGELDNLNSRKERESMNVYIHIGREFFASHSTVIHYCLLYFFAVSFAVCW